MKRSTESPPSQSGSAPSTPGWSRGLRTFVSVLVVLHLAAVIIPPFTLATSSPMEGTVSPLASRLLVIVRPYVEAAYLWHGYAFFAPNPGPSHLVRYRLTFDDGRPPIVAMFPDRQRHWPRLLYHRHFMLAEQLHADFVPPRFEDLVEMMTEPPDGAAPDPNRATNLAAPPSGEPNAASEALPPSAVQPEEIATPSAAQLEEMRRYWELSRQVYEAKWRSFEHHLLVQNGAQGVEVSRVEHGLLSPDAFLSRGIPLNAEELYIELPEDERPRARPVANAPPSPLRSVDPAPDAPAELLP
jgi:hypothetical protein